ncbi:MAG: hypothetical protein M1836_002191 [Candelina mexicana]|nr:MAG: hypothetical protein M1836_002191 [Candelina mexicana]
MSGLEIFGVVASVAALVKVGAALSYTLFSLSDGYGSAATELGDIAVDISMFSSTLKQLASTLETGENPDHHLLVNVNQVVERCQDLFDHIGLLLSDLRNDGTKVMDKLEFVRKMRWHFRRPKVLLIRGTIDSFKTTLSLMLATQDLVRIYSSTDTTVRDHDDNIDHDRMLVKSLIMADRLSITNLRRLEEQAENEGPSDIPIQQQDGTIQYLHRSGEALHRPRFSQSSSYLSNMACLDAESLNKRERQAMPSPCQSTFVQQCSERSSFADLTRDAMDSKETLVTPRVSIHTYLDVSQDEDIAPAVEISDKFSIHSVSSSIMSRDAESTMERLLQKWSNRTEENSIDTRVPCPQVLVDAGYPSFTGQERVMLRAAFGDLYTFCRTWHKKTSGRFHKPFKSEDWEWKLHAVGQLVFGELGFMGKLTRDFKQLDAMKNSLLSQNEGLVGKIRQLERANRSLEQKLDVIISVKKDRHDEEIRTATESRIQIASLIKEKEILEAQLHTARIESTQDQQLLSNEAQAGTHLLASDIAFDSDHIVDPYKFKLVNGTMMPDTPPASPDRPDTSHARSRADTDCSQDNDNSTLPTELKGLRAWVGGEEAACPETIESNSKSSSSDAEKHTPRSILDQMPRNDSVTLPTNVESSQDWAVEAQLSIRQLTVNE